jgi:peptide subunit release factor 1 (eRF1)
MATDLQAMVQTLTALSATERPLLSAYVDWTPDGNGKRPQLETFTASLDDIVERYRGEPDDRESVEADRERIMAYLDTEAPADAKGIAIFACFAEDIWETIPLQVSVETSVVADSYPHIFNLARLLDEYETYAIVLADAQESRILVVSLNEAERVGSTEASEDIKRFDAGGWAQMLFQRRTDNIIKAHTKELADRLGRIIKRHDVQHVIIAANDSIKGMVRDSLPQPITDKLVDVIRLDLTANMNEIMQTLEPIMRGVEEEQERNDLAELEGEVRGNNLGVVGVGDTAMALTKGQVRTLLMRDDFQGAGGECPNCGTIRAGLRPTCPYDGAEMQQVDLREMFTTRALQQGSTLQIVAESAFLDQHEGVGAVLRYKDTAPQTT